MTIFTGKLRARVKREPDLYERELARYREALKLDAEAAHNRYGMTFINSLNPAERALVLKGMGIEITEALDFYNLGCQSAREENWTDAIIHFKRAIEMDSSLTDAIHNLAICYEKTGHAPQAKSTWEVYANVIEDDDEVHRVHEHMGEL